MAAEDNNEENNNTETKDSPIKEDSSIIDQDKLKTVLNQQSNVLESNQKEIISIKTEVQDLRSSLKDIAIEAGKAGAVEVINAITGQAQAAQPQQSPNTTQTPSNTIQTQMNTGTANGLPLGNLAALLDPNTIQSLSGLVQSLAQIYQSFQPPDPMASMSIFNEKRLAQLGIRYLNLLLGEANNNLTKLEKTAGVPENSFLHEVK